MIKVNNKDKGIVRLFNEVILTAEVIWYGMRWKDNHKW
jgi:hypothetical protein